MLAQIRQFLAPPVFEGDEDKTRTASVLNTILLTWAAMAVMIGIAILFTAPNKVLPLVINVPVALLTLGMWFIMRRGYVRLSGVLISLQLNLLFVFVTVSFGGLREPAFSFFVVAVLVTGLLLGGRAAFTSAGFGALAGLGILCAQINDLLPPPVMPPATLPFAWVIVSLIFVMAATILHLATRSISDALERARRYAAELEEQRARLEETVEERTHSLARRAHYLEATAEVARGAAAMLDLHELLSRIAALVSERFGFYHTGIFLLDPIMNAGLT